MAVEKWTVFYKLEDAGSPQPATFTAGEVVVKGKNKAKGFLTGTGLLTNEVLLGRTVTIEAESAEEACLAVETYYGKGNNNGKAMACLTANLTEVSVA